MYAAAVSRLQLRARKIASFWSDYDLLLTPTLAMPPVPVGWEAEPEDPWEQFDRAVQFTPFTAAFNVTGQPAVSLPLHWTDTGCRSASNSSVHRSATHSSSESSRRSRPRGPGPTRGRRTRKKDVRDGDTAPRTPL